MAKKRSPIKFEDSLGLWLAAAQSPLASYRLQEQKIEEAVSFLVHMLGAGRKSGKKPVILHSLRVGFILLSAGYSDDVAVAGILHDVLERAGLTKSHLARRFNPTVADLVEAATNDERIDCIMERYRDSVDRCAELGENALAIRAADLIDNCDRALMLDQEARLKRYMQKLSILLEVCREDEIDTRLVGELAKRSRRVARRLSSNIIERASRLKNKK